MHSGVAVGMKAALYDRYGPPDVVRPGEVARPAPGDDEIQVRVRAASVGYGDVLARRFASVSRRDFNMPSLFWLLARLQFGWRRPRIRILGAEFAGDVAGVGGAVTRFREGDAVFGYRGAAFGAHAEYLCLPADGLVAAKPAGMTYDEAAAVPYGAITALNLLGKVDIGPGRKVLVVGASGSIGSAAVQLARHRGAEVTGVCATPGLEYVRALGAHRVVDYTREDFAGTGDTYDVIFDVPGRGSFRRARRALEPGGRYLLASFKARRLARMLWTSITAGKDGKRLICALSMEQPADLERVRELVDAGAIRAVIERRFPLERAADAHRHFEAGHRTGKVVITVAESA